MNARPTQSEPPTVGVKAPGAGLALIPGVVLALGVFLVYWQVRTCDFVNFDDPDYVSANPMVQAGLTPDSVRWAFTQAHSSNWHPLTWLSHMLDCQWFGLNAGAHHLVNVAFHAVNSLLVFTLLLGLTGARWRSALVAGLFALHPLHVESVAWIAERKDVLSAFFGLLTLLAYSRYVRQLGMRNSKPAKRNWGALAAYLLALGLFALGLMSKPMLVTWPCVMLLLDFWPLNRLAFGGGDRWRALAPLLLEKIPFVGLTVASSVVTVIVQRSSGATVPLEVLPMDLRLAQMFAAYLRYLGKTFWPEGLAAFYPYTAVEWDSEPALTGLVVVLAVSAVALAQFRRRPFLVVGWFWFVGTLVPVIGLVQVGRQSIADRYTYLPHIGLFVAIVWLTAELAERLKIPRLFRWIACAVVLMVCGVMTFRQVDHWRNTLTLARHAAEVTTGNYIAHAQAATALVAEGRLDEALAECEQALRIRPDYAEGHNTFAMIYSRQARFDDAIASYREAIRCDATFPDAFHGLADVYFKLGKLTDAEQASRQAVELWPLHTGALFILASSLHNQGKLEEAIATYRRLIALKPGLFSAHRGLGGALASRGELPAAALEFQRALELQPRNADAHNSLGLVRLAQGETVAASNHFSLALSVQPTNAIANYQIAMLLTAARKPAQAVEHYRLTLQAQPDLPDVLNNLAWLLAASGDAAIRNGPEAVRLAERACALTGNKEPFLLGTLAAAYAETGRYSEAVTTAQKAIELAQAAGLDEVAGRNRQLLERYRAGKAFHEEGSRQ